MTASEGRKLRVAIVMSAPEDIGGGFVQSVNIAKLFEPDENSVYTVEYLAVDRADLAALRREGICITESRGSWSGIIEKCVMRSPLLRAILRKIYRITYVSQNSLDKLARQRGYDLFVFTSPSRRVQKIKTTPFIYTVWDVCHRDHPEFPEIARDGTFDWREKLFRYALPRASAFIVDSAAMATRLAQAYGVDPGKAIIVPLQPPAEIRLAPPTSNAEFDAVRMKYGLDRPYLYYPAQFWPHKNHSYILRGIKILRETRGIDLYAVFSGSDQGNLGRVQILAEKLGVADRMKCIGFVPTREVVALYRGAVSAVMPSYFGPTNIPPLEAQALGCPLIYSDEPGHRDVGGEAALYCDLSTPESLAECVVKVLSLPRPAPVNVDRTASARNAVRQAMKRIGAKIETWSTNC